MKRLLALLVGVAAFTLAAQAQAQTEEIQALTQVRLQVEKFQAQAQERDEQLRLLIEKLQIEAQKREQQLWKEIKQLQTAVKELKEQGKKGKKKELSGKEEVEMLRAKLADAEARAKQAEFVAKAQTQRAQAALEEARAKADLAQAEAARFEALRAEAEAKIRALEREIKLLKGEKDPAPPAKGLPKIDVPKEPVKGKVTKVDPDDTALLEIDLGSDHGLKGGHSLEIFRLTPQPTYLGTLRILQVRPTRSVGRVVATNPLKKETLIKVGDQVASQIK